MNKMREIKFRGRNLKGEWVYGMLAHPTTKVGSVDPGYYISNSVGRPFAYAVRPETVGQFTGLKDRTGKNVYEGDILDFQFGIGLMAFEGMSLGMKRRVGIWSKRTEKYENCQWAESLEYYKPECITAGEIIGNIHDNPELLKEE